MASFFPLSNTQLGMAACFLSYMGQGSAVRTVLCTSCSWLSGVPDVQVFRGDGMIEKLRISTWHHVCPQGSATEQSVIMILDILS